jgi:hypothetical protein
MQALKNPLQLHPKTRSFEKIHITENRFVKLWYDWDKSDMFENNEDYKEVFKFFVKSATPFQIKVFKKRRFYILERGSVFTSIRQIAEASQVSIKKVRNAIDRFVEHKALEVDVKRGIGTIFKIVNYSKYQDKDVRHTSNVISFQKHLDLVKKSNTFNNKAHTRHTDGTQRAHSNISIKEQKEQIDKKEVSTVTATQKNKTNFFNKKMEEEDLEQISQKLKNIYQNLNPKINIKNYMQEGFLIEYKTILENLKELNLQDVSEEELQRVINDETKRFIGKNLAFTLFARIMQERGIKEAKRMVDEKAKETALKETQEANQEAFKSLKVEGKLKEVEERIKELVAFAKCEDFGIKESMASTEAEKQKNIKFAEERLQFFKENEIWQKIKLESINGKKAIVKTQDMITLFVLQGDINLRKVVEKVIGKAYSQVYKQSLFSFEYTTCE